MFQHFAADIARCAGDGDFKAHDSFSCSSLPLLSGKHHSSRPGESEGRNGQNVVLVLIVVRMVAVF
jgi:hypothetical protein